MIIIAKVRIIEFNKIEYDYYKIYYYSREQIDVQDADRIKLIYYVNEVCFASIVRTGEDEKGKFLVVHLWNNSTLQIGEVSVELIFSPRKSIKGVDLCIELFEYWSSLHDDVIKEVKMDCDGLAMTIHMEARPDKAVEHDITLKFKQIESMDLHDWCSFNIIFNIDFEYKQNYIEVEICSSSGLRGSILCKDISIEMTNITGNNSPYNSWATSHNKTFQSTLA